MPTQTFSIATGADDTERSANTSATYPPTDYSNLDTTGIGIAVLRTLSGGSYASRVGLLKFDTSALPDTATITAASLKLHVTGTLNTNSRSLVGEYYTWTGVTGDGTSTAPASPVLSSTIASLTTGAVNTIAFTNLSGISKTGTTYLRLQISGGQPTGANQVSFAAFEHATSPEPQLVVTYVTTNPPTADFSSSANQLAVQFTDTSTADTGLSITAWDWNFGDGTAHGTTQNPAHTYATAGTKSVTLTVTDSVGGTNSVTKSVTVSSNQPPTANFTFSGAALAKTFTDTSTDADGTVNAWSWNFGDGSSLVTTQNPSHTYAANGTYSVTLTVTDNLGSTGSVTKSVTAIQPGSGRAYETKYIAARETTLSIGMNASQTAVVLTELAYWPATGEAVVGTEIISWTGKSTPSGIGNLTGVTRGMYGTTAASHSPGATIGLLGRHDGAILTRRKVSLFPDNATITLQELRRHTDLDKFVWADLNNLRERAVLEITGEPQSSGNIVTTFDENGTAVPRPTAVTATKEVRSLTINNAQTAAGSVTVTLDGVSRTVSLPSGREKWQVIISGLILSDDEFNVYLDNVEYATNVFKGDSADMVAGRVRATTYPGWTTSGSGTTVIFEADDSAPHDFKQTTYGSFGVTSTRTQLASGGALASAIGVATEIRLASFSGWRAGGSGATVTFTSLQTGAKSGSFSYSAGITGATSTAGLTQTTAGSSTTVDAIASAIVATYSANTYWSVSAAGSVVTFAATIANAGIRQDGTFSPGSTGTQGKMTITEQGSTDVVVHAKDSNGDEQKRRVLANLTTSTTFYIETAVSGAGTDKGVVTVWGAFGTDPLTHIWRVTDLDLTDYPLGAIAYGVTYESSTGLTWDVHTDEVEITNRGKTYYRDHTALGGWINQARYYGRLESYQARNDLFIQPPENVMMIPVIPGETMTLAAILRWENIPADVPAKPLFVTCHHADGSITQLQDIASPTGITGTSAWTEPTPYTFTIPGPDNTNYENQSPCYWIEVSSRDMSGGTVVIQEIVPSPGASTKRTYYYATDGSVRATFGLETPRVVPHINVSRKRIALEGQANAPAGTTISWRYRSAVDKSSLDPSGWLTDPEAVKDLTVVEAEAMGLSDGLTPFVVRAGYPRVEYRLILANEFVSVLLTEMRREFDGGVFINGYEDWYEDPGASQVILPSGRVRQGELHAPVGQIDEISFAAMRPETVQYLQKNWVKGHFIVERAEELLTVKLKGRPNFKRRTRPYISNDPNVEPGRVGYWVSDAIPAEVLAVQAVAGTVSG